MDLNNVEFTWIKNKPMNWEIHRVKNHFVLTKNKTDSPEGYPILSLTMRGIIERDISSNEGQLPETYNGYNLLEKDDIVFNPMDLISGWVDCSPHEGLISPSYKVIRPTSSEVDIKFYTYYFQTHYKEKIFFPFGEGVHYEYRWGLGTETLKNFPIVVPPLSEQQQIVSFLDTKTSLIDSLIEKTQRKIELLKEKRTSIINEIVTKGLNPNVEMKDSEVKWIGKIPLSWKKISLGKIGNLYGGLTGKSGDDFRSENNPMNKPFIPFTNIFNNTYISKNHFQNVVVEKHENQNKVKKFDLFFLMSSEEYDDLGKSSIIIEDVDELYLNSFCKGFRIINDDVYPLFLNYQLLGDTHRKLISTEGNGFTRINLRQDRLKETQVFIPPLLEQKQIVEYLDEQTQKIDKKISIEEKKIKLLKEYRQSLISEVVTGKLKVTTDE